MENDVREPTGTQPQRSAAVLDLGRGLRLRVIDQSARAIPDDVTPEAGEHFYACLLQQAHDVAEQRGPAAPGPFDEVDPYYLTLKAVTFGLVRALLRRKTVIHDRENREGTCAAVAALAAWWAPLLVSGSPRVRPVPLGFVTLLRPGVVPLDVALALPFHLSDPVAWTDAQRGALDRFLAIIGPAHERWEADVFQPAQRLARLSAAEQEASGAPRLRAVAGAWADWWRFRIAPWWEADAVGPTLARGFEGAAKNFPELRLAWHRALREHEWDAQEAACDIANAYAGRGDSVQVTVDGRAVPNFRNALREEARRQQREDKRGERERAGSPAIQRVVESGSEAQTSAAAAAHIEGLDALESALAPVEQTEELTAFLATLEGPERLVAENRRLSTADLALVLGGVSEGRVSQIRGNVVRLAADFARRRVSPKAG